MKTLLILLPFFIIESYAGPRYWNTRPDWEEEEDALQPGQSEAERRKKAKENEESLKRMDKKIREPKGTEDPATYRYDIPDLNPDSSKGK